MPASTTIDWLRIVEKIEGSGGTPSDLFLFIIPDAGRHLLLSDSVRLKWQSTFGDVPMTDDLEGVIDDTIDALMGDDKLSDIVDAIKYLVDNWQPSSLTVDNSNTNTNSGGGGCCVDFTIPTDQNGDNFPLIPVDPNDPLGELEPTWDDVEETPPTGYDDWQSFIDDRCRASNYFVDSYLEVVKKSDLIERQVSIGASIMEVVALIIASLPGPVGDYAGVVVIARWVARMAGLLAEGVDELEDLNDWLQIGADSVEANREVLVCAAYQMTTTAYLKEFFLTFFAGYINPDLTAAGVSTDGVDFMRSLFDGLAEGLANKVADGFANMNIPDDYQPGTDCANCTLESDVYLETINNSSQWVERTILPVGHVAIMNALRSDQYGPFASIRFTDEAGTPINVTATNYQIVTHDGWVGGFPYTGHVFVCQTKNVTGTNAWTEIANGQPFPLPYLLTRETNVNTMGILEVASAVGSSFTVGIKRLA